MALERTLLMLMKYYFIIKYHKTVSKFKESKTMYIPSATLNTLVENAQIIP